MYRRTRKPNFSHEETMALLEQMEIHRHILLGKATNHQRAELWTVIADSVNAVPNSAGRTVEELKHRWKDMSHRARISARNFSQAKVNNEQTTVVPSIYFDIIMRILGEDCMMLTNGSSFTEYSPMCLKSEVDVKPDINKINHFLNSENVHSLKMNFGSASGIATENQSVHNGQTVSSHNTGRVQNSILQLSPTSRKYTSFPLQCIPTAEDDHSVFNAVLSSGHNGSKPISSELSTKRPPSQTSMIRPMRFDPVTQEVTEVDGHDLDSETSTDGSSSSNMTLSVADAVQETRIANGREIAEKSVTATSLHDHPPRKKRRLDTSFDMQSLSMEDLKKLYMIKKIKMISQRTLCFRLLEEKLKCEIRLIKQQALIGNISSHHQGSHQYDGFRLLEKCKVTGQKGKNVDDDNVTDSGSKYRHIGDENFERNRAVNKVDNVEGNSDNDNCNVENHCLSDGNSNSSNGDDSQDIDETIFKQNSNGVGCERQDCYQV